VRDATLIRGSSHCLLYRPNVTMWAQVAFDHSYRTTRPGCWCCPPQSLVSLKFGRLTTHRANKHLNFPGTTTSTTYR